MAATTPYMGLKVWNSLDDSFDHTQLAENFAKIDQHNHAEGKGTKIPTGGIEDGAISAAKLATDAVTDAKLLNSPIRGLVQATGVITLGTGFTVTLTGTGTYVITFSPALPSTPVIVSIVANNSSGVVTTTLASTTEAKISTFNGSGTALSLPFYFVAYPS